MNYMEALEMKNEKKFVIFILFTMLCNIFSPFMTIVNAEEMTINDYKIGTSFEINCAKHKHIKMGETVYDSFGIDKKFANLYGRSPEQVIRVKCTIIEEDVIIKDLMNKDSDYDENSIYE